MSAETEFLIRSCKGQRLLDDTITREYADLGQMCRLAIDDFLSNPDSGIDTGLRLLTDEGAVHTTRVPKNFEREELLDAVKATADELGYDGYLMEQANIIVLKEIPTIRSNPPVCFCHPFTKLKPEFDIDFVKNVIFAWGEKDQGFPVDDLWCEYGVQRFSPAAWAIWDTNSDCEITDFTSNKKIGEASTKLIKLNATGNMGCKFNIPASGYTRPQGSGNYIDCTENSEAPDNGRFAQFLIYWYNYRSGLPTNMLIDLEDSAGNKIGHDSGTQNNMTWIETKPSVGEDEQIGSGYELGPDPDWGYLSGSSFNWKIETIHFTSTNFAVGEYVLFDGMCFIGTNMKIHPFTNPLHNPVAEDPTSPGYPRVHHLTEDIDIIHCFEHAQETAKLYLSVHKNPFEKVKVAKGFKPWLMPHNLVKLSLPEWNIHNEDWRVIGIEHDWNRERKVCLTTAEVMPAAWRLPSKTMLRSRLGGFLKIISDTRG